MANTLKFGNGEWYGKKDTILAYNDENNNYKPLPFDFSRGSSATVVNKDGLIETVGSGEPRIDYKDNSKGALLLEPSRTNLITYSEDFSDSSWNVFRGSVTSNVAISPDGTLNASRYQEDSQTGKHLFRRQSLSIINGLSYTGSIFAKKGELTSIDLQSNSSSRWVASASFDLENGVVISGTGVIEDYGNGWYRCSISGNAVQTTPDAGLEIYTSVGAGRDGQGLFMYGAMFEQGSYATSYIPTQGGVVTRLAETCSQTAPDGVIGQTEGTIFLDVKMPSVIQSSTTFSIGGGSNGEYAQLEIRSDLSINWRYRQGDVDYINANVGSYVGGDRLKLAFAYKNGSSVLYKNGVSIATDTGSIGSNSWNNVYFSNYAGTGKLNADVNQTSLYNTRLSNSELQALTTI